MSKARDQLFHDVFVTALAGGINYWASVSDYHWSVNDDGHTEDRQRFKATLSDEVDPGPEMYLNRAVIAKGYDLATTSFRDTISWSAEKPPLVVTGDDHDWDFDAGDADVIVQLGLYGDVVYG